VIACSESVLRELERAGIEAECVYLPVPGPGNTYVRSPAIEPRILFNGRLDREKGVEQLLLAFARVSAANDKATLRIAGRGPLRPQLETVARELGVGGQVTFLGWQEPAQIEREIAEAWVVAAPSLWPEPLGLVALEAMVRGVPVIASSVGGFAEIIEDGVSGTLVKNGDVTALAEGLIAILDRRRFAGGLPPEVIRRVRDRHDMTRHIARMRSAFTEVVAA
jgi:glycosyltransferase involved in cell wall biosynthesis